MPEWSRRRALHALAAGTTAAFAGCSGEQRFEGESPPDPSRGVPVEEYSTRKVRSAERKALFWRAETPTDADANADADADANADRARRNHEFLTDGEDVGNVTFAPDSDTAATLRRVAEETDYETASVSLHSYGIGECFDLRLRGVTRESDGFRVAFCRALRDATVACERTDRDTVAFAIRLPFPGDDVHGYGASWSRRCRDRPHPITPNPPTEGTEDA